MAWPSLPTSLTNLCANLWTAQQLNWTAKISKDAAWVHWNAGADHACLMDFLLWADSTYTALEYTYSGNSMETIKTLLCAVLTQMRSEYQAGAYSLTMPKLLTCMVTAQFTELQEFIGIEDAYRMALWNAPFNVDFYAALGRGFATWG